MLRHAGRDRHVDRGVVVHAVARAHHHGGSEERPPRESDARLQRVLVGLQQRIRITPAGKLPGRIRRHYRRDCGEAGGDIQVHQAPEELRDRRAVLPAQPAVDRERRAEAPVVIHEGVVIRGAKVLVGIAVGDRARVGNAEQESGEVIARRGAGEGERAARILLRERIELLSAEAGAGAEIVRSPSREERSRHAAGLIACQRVLRVRQRGNPAREIEIGRTPVHRFLVVACDSRLAGNVPALREVRRRARGKAAELIAHGGEGPLGEAVHPVERQVEAQRAGRVEEAEEVRVVRTRALQRKRAVDLVSVLHGFVHAGLEAVLVRRSYERNLVVVARGCIEIRQRVEREQRLRLGTDPALGNHAAWK